MVTQEYPGASLSLSQLAFALNERLKRTEISSLYTFDDVSQLDRDVSTALANIREWRNSFVPVNRVPLDVLSLVPNHLSSQTDRFHSTFVCRHWRRTFIQQGVLWSQLTLKRGEVYVKTLLERAKGSAIDIIISDDNLTRAMRLLPPYTQQIRSISFVHTCWEDVQQFCQINSEPLPLLRTLALEVVPKFTLDNLINPITPPLTPLFSNALNVKVLTLCGLTGYTLLRCFFFPNLTTFEYSAAPTETTYQALELLDFLEASPMLITVSVEITVQLLGFDNIPEERVVMLPVVETFSLTVNDDDALGYKLATHISCPSAKHTSLVHGRSNNNDVPRLIFPSSHRLYAIIRQYPTGPIEEIALEMKFDEDPILSCSLTFRSAGANALGLEFKLYIGDSVRSEELHWEPLSYASATIQSHPLLHNVKRLLIGYRCFISHFRDPRSSATAFRKLVESMGPLDLLSVFGLDPQVFLTPFLNIEGIEEFDHKRPIAYPPIKELKIFHPSMPYYRKECVLAIVEFSKSQYARGTPFERLELCMEELPTGTAERLRPWVGEVECYEALCEDIVKEPWEWF